MRLKFFFNFSLSVRLPACACSCDKYSSNVSKFICIIQVTHSMFHIKNSACRTNASCTETRGLHRPGMRTHACETKMNFLMGWVGKTEMNLPTVRADKTDKVFKLLNEK